MSGIDAVVVALQVFAALSLAWCLWASQQDATGSSFFSLQARAWEPLAGGLIAAAEIRRRSEGIADPAWLQSPIVAVAGWMLVAGCVVYPLPEARWPGVLTMLPVLGSAIIIAARQGSRAGGLLGASAIQRVGDWSYSIYLWHWPVWVFALSWLSVRGYGVGAMQKTWMVLLSLALGAISYRYVEQPFRIRRDFWTPRRLLGGSAVAFALLAGFV
jgi:peptidoglycan/LPS O-acetylase OafA/YrhL